ncbi:MAG: protein kinase, partial [Myxococcales bacterium]|nr:protein kinase [Myxococcales bacterium]
MSTLHAVCALVTRPCYARPVLDESVTAERLEPVSLPEAENETCADSKDSGPEGTRVGESRRTKRLAIGERFAGFQIRGELGHGAMGVVYEAWDPNLERRVALKLLRSPSKRAAERLLREARALARLDHPGVVRIWAADVHRGAVYIAMELIEG